MNQTDANFVLLLVAALQVKHFVCDGPLQTLAMVQAKRHYGRIRGLAHAFIHGVGTLLMLLMFGVPLSTALTLSILDTVVHYHIDFSKENIVHRAGWTTSDARFWWAYAADQGLHHLTYLLIAGLVFRA